MTTLLPLRAEVKITRVSADGMGAPRWLLEDQVRNSFFNIDWPTYEILTRWSYADPELIVEAVNQQTTLTLTADDVAEAVRWSVMLPHHFNIDLMVIRPLAQAAQHKVVRRG